VVELVWYVAAPPLSEELPKMVLPFEKVTVPVAVEG
jgi:hypothetical protein